VGLLRLLRDLLGEAGLMSADVMRLPLPEPDDAHPLDWYPGDEPEERTVEEANRWVDETLTRREDMVLLQGSAGSDCTPPALYTTSPGKEIVMPSHDTALRSLHGRMVRRAQDLRALADGLESVGFLSDADTRALILRMEQQARVLSGDAALLEMIVPPDPRRVELERLHQAARIRRSRGQGAASRVYFLHCVDCHLVKIGVSRDYRKRWHELERTTEHILDVLGSFEGDRQVEADVHAMFREDRVEGEWFRSSERLLTFIRDRATRPTDLPPWTGGKRYR
jgi:hypothetical protein